MIVGINGSLILIKGESTRREVVALHQSLNVLTVRAKEMGGQAVNDVPWSQWVPYLQR